MIDIEIIDVNKIRGRWQESHIESFHIQGTDRIHKQPMVSGGDDMVESIRMVAEKVNEIINALRPPTT